MENNTSPDRAYLLRCWQESNSLPHAPSWHFSVEEVLHERIRWALGDLDALIAFLRVELKADRAQAATDE